MKKTCVLLLCLLLAAVPDLSAQFTMQGRIEYERKMNLHRPFENEDWFERFKSQVPRFNVTYFELSFNTAKSVYKPGRESPGNSALRMFGGMPGGENIVFTDYAGKKVEAHKQVFETDYLVQDSMRKMQWKITDEVRIIADYKCRKAVGRICDSVYVVAFYTDDIAVSGGPEMFCGLPGMILEIAIPRLYSTWTATKVELITPADKDLVPPVKGKKTSQEALFRSLQASLKDWGKYGQRNIWLSLL